MKMMVRLLFAVVTLLVLAFGVHRSQAVVPPPDGGYPGFNTAEGQNALFNLSTGVANTAVGWNSLRSDTEGSYNVGFGAGTLIFNSTGNSNTAIGTAALLLNATGIENTAVGVAALLNNDPSGNHIANFNSAFGAHALESNTEGQANSAFGVGAMASNTTGLGNTAIGVGALFQNAEGSNNTAIGFDSLLSNTTGNQNTATGWSALYHNTSGLFNTANGMEALLDNTEGLSNTAVGWGALLHNVTGSNNTAIGVRAGQDITGDFNICIGSQVIGLAGDHHTIRIGDNLSETSEPACYIGGIWNQGATISGQAVFVSPNGKLGTTLSSRRFKEQIQPMNNASEVLFALQPVSFRYKKELDPAGVRQFGLVAEDVAKVNPDLVSRDTEGKPTAVRYDQINAMLLNEFLKEHRRNEEQTATIARLEQKIEALTAGLQKVVSEFELSKHDAQTVLNTRQGSRR